MTDSYDGMGDDLGRRYADGMKRLLTSPGYTPEQVGDRTGWT